MRVSIACCTSWYDDTCYGMIVHIACSISTSWYDGTCHDMIVHIACSMYHHTLWYDGTHCVLYVMVGCYMLWYDSAHCVLHLIFLSVGLPTSRQAGAELDWENVGMGKYFVSHIIKGKYSSLSQICPTFCKTKLESERFEAEATSCPKQSFNSLLICLKFA